MNDNELEKFFKDQAVYIECNEELNLLVDNLSEDFMQIEKDLIERFEKLKKQLESDEKKKFDCDQISIVPFVQKKLNRLKKLSFIFNRD